MKPLTTPIPKRLLARSTSEVNFVPNLVEEAGGQIVISWVRGGDAWGGGASMRGTGGPGIPSQSESMPNALCRQVDQSALSFSSFLAWPNCWFGPRQNLLRAIIKLSGPKIREGGIKRTNW